MAVTVRAPWLGLQAAVRVAGVVRHGGLAPLLVPPPAAPSPHAAGRRRRSAAREAAVATRVAFALLARLARVAPGRWRNTCLFRAAAECWILRRAGFPAVLRIGVARASAADPSAHARDRATPESDDVVAHAWVECPSVRCLTARGDEHLVYAPLHHGANVGAWG